MRIPVIAVLALAAAAGGGPASALHFSPVSSNFVGTGSLFLVEPSGVAHTCTSQYTLKTNAGTGVGLPVSRLRITGLTLTGTGCSSLTPANFNWIANANSPTTLTSSQFNAVEFVTGSGACGPAILPVTLSASTITYSVTIGGCVVRDVVAVSPALTITTP
jgi:hypothetical protein